MSTITLILIIIMICLICLSCLWFIQVKRQRAIERARKSALYNSRITQLHEISVTIAHFLDDQLILFLANRIIHTIHQLNINKLTPAPHSVQVFAQAQDWIKDPGALRTLASATPEESRPKQLSLLKAIVGHIRESLQEHKLTTNDAQQLVKMAKLGKIKSSYYHNQKLANESLQQGDLKYGLLLLHRIKSLLKGAPHLDNELKQQLIACNNQIDEIQKALDEQAPSKQSENKDSKRLADEFDKLEAQQQDWQKKQLYD